MNDLEGPMGVVSMRLYHWSGLSFKSLVVLPTSPNMSLHGPSLSKLDVRMGLHMYIHTALFMYIYPESPSLYFVYPLEKTELYREKLFFSRVVLGYRPAYSYPCTFQHWPLKIFHLLRWRSSFNISNPPKLNHTTVHNASYTQEIERWLVVTWLLILLYIAAMNAHSVMAKEKKWAALSTHNDGTCGIQLESRFTTRGNYPVRRTEWLS